MFLEAQREALSTICIYIHVQIYTCTHKYTYAHIDRISRSISPRRCSMRLCRQYIFICKYTYIYTYIYIYTHLYRISISACSLRREVGGWGRDPFSRNLMSPTPRRKWYLTTGRRFH